MGCSLVADAFDIFQQSHHVLGLLVGVTLLALLALDQYVLDGLQFQHLLLDEVVVLKLNPLLRHTCLVEVLPFPVYDVLRLYREQLAHILSVLGEWSILIAFNEDHSNGVGWRLNKE
jgi:hypothetical protein